MRFLVYSDVTAQTLPQRLGSPEYSYHFVLQGFLPALRQLGDVEQLERAHPDADRRYDACEARGEDCLLFSFSPPHRTPLPQRCPVVPVIAWEYDTLPNEVGDGSGGDDWVEYFRRAGRLVVHSRHTVQVVRRHLGSDFPVASIPCPVWDRFETCRAQYPAAARTEPTVLEFAGATTDSDRTDLSLPVWPASEAEVLPWERRFQAAWRRLRAFRRDITWDLLSPATAARVDRTVAAVADWCRRRGAPTAVGTTAVPLSGVVYTSVFNPHDGRKNWLDMVLAFCTALRGQDDAVLVLKFAHRDPELPMALLDYALRRLPPFRCRVVATNAFLDDLAYERLIGVTTYAVNSSRGEGQCLPLMEFMACGRPALAPRHPALGDYIDTSTAFVADSDLEPCCWPQDRLGRYRAHQHRLNWMSMVRCFEDSYHVARHQPGQYRAMAQAAQARQEANCSLRAAVARLRQFLDLPADIGRPAGRPDTEGGVPTSPAAGPGANRVGTEVKMPAAATAALTATVGTAARPGVAGESGC